SRMGTPEEMSVPRVRVNRATATFRIRTPNTGSLSRSASIIIWPDPVAAHQLARRDARLADRRGGPARAPDPADHRPRDRRAGGHRPAGRLLLRGVAHGPARARGRSAGRRDPVDRRRREGGRARLARAPDRPFGPGLPTGG